jgi:hypothetical protein
MALLILMFAAGLIAYMLASGRLDNTAQQASASGSKLYKDTKTATNNLWARTKRFFRRESAKDSTVSFKAWVAKSDLFPTDFKGWIASLTEEEARVFSKSLDQYASAQNFSLTALVAGGMDQMPGRRKVFVEAIVIYSHAYRKLAEAKQEEKPKPEQPEKPVAEEKKVAEKAVSRRKSENTQETHEVAVATQ